MKKLLSVLTVAAMIACSASAVMAADKSKAQPDVVVDGSKVMFDDQNAQIVNDVTLVPARGVFEAMGCKVSWDGDKREVTVTSATGVRVVTITIDSDIMKIHTYKSLMERDTKDFNLEVPAQILNDRTMIPLRAVSEAFNSTVNWDGESYVVNITSGEPMYLDGYTAPAPVPDEQKPTVSLSTDHTGAIKAGDEFTVYVDVKNGQKDSFISAVYASFAYDKNQFEYVEGSGTLLGNSDEAISASVSAENPDYEKGAKTVFVTIDDKTAKTADGHAFKATFRAKTDGKGTIKLSNDFESVIGYESYVMYTKEYDDTIYDGTNVVIDKTPLVIGE